MNSSDKAYTSSPFIISEINGSDGVCGLSTAIVPVTKIPYFTAHNKENKSAVTLEQLFVPIASNSGEIPNLGNLPFMDVTQITDGSQSNLAGRFEYGTVVTIGNSGSTSQPVVRSVGHALPMYAAGFGYDVKNELAPRNYFVTVPNNGATNSNGFLAVNYSDHYLQEGDSVVIDGVSSSFGNSYEGIFKVKSVSNRNNFILDLPVSGSINGVMKFAPTKGNPYSSTTNTVRHDIDVQSWKAGPVDLRWDETRALWCGSDFFRNDIVYGYLTSDITPAYGRNRPSSFTMVTYKPNLFPSYVDRINQSSPTVSDSSTYVQFSVSSNSAYFEPGQTITLVNSSEPSYNADHYITMVNGTSVTTDTPFIDGTDGPSNSWIIPSNSGNTASQRQDKEYIVYNYSTHLSVDLESACDEISNGGCAQKINDIFVVALRVAFNKLILVYVDF